MTAIDKMSDAEFDSLALAILGRESGVDGLARFLKLHGSGCGDYTVERHDLLQGVSVDDIARSIQTRRSRTA